MDPRFKQPDTVRSECDDLVHRFTHDLRACLRAIATLPEWIREDLDDVDLRLPKDVLHHLDMIEKQAARADHLINDTRAYYEASIGAPDFVTVDLTDAINRSVSAMDWPDRVQTMVDVQARQVHLPEGHLEQVLGIVLNNSVTHSKSEALRITISNAQNFDMIDISDDGPGIPDAFAERIFEPLVTLQPRDVVEGSGMGLAIARKLAEAWGGTVALLPNGGETGAQFRITLPSS